MKIFSVILLMSFHVFLCAEGRLVQIDETQKLWVQQHGSGSPTIILINGGGDTIDTEWIGIIPKLSKVSSVLAYDRAGQVKSLGPSDIKTPRAAKEIVAQLRMLLSKLEIKPPYILVAHSSGGLYAQYFARNYPDDVKGLVMINGNLPAEQLPERDPKLSRKMVKFINQYNQAHEAKMKAQYEKVLKQIHGAPTIKQNAQIAYSLEVMGKKESIEQIIQSPPLSKDLELAVLVSGKFPPEIAMQRHFSEEVPGSTFRIFPNAGHYIQKDKPGAVIKIIEAVVQKIRAMNPVTPQTLPNRPAI